MKIERKERERRGKKSAGKGDKVTVSFTLPTPPHTKRAKL
jgi:hypothetical protein